MPTSRRQSDRFIPGIFNYCDRWCERCEFSHRCRNYAMELAEGTSDAERDINNAAFWNKLSSHFAMAKALLQKIAEEEGVDLSPESLEEAAAEEKARKKLALKDGRVCDKMAEKYWRGVQAFFKKQPELMPEHAQGLSEEVALGITGLRAPNGQRARDRVRHLDIRLNDFVAGVGIEFTDLVSGFLFRGRGWFRFHTARQQECGKQECEMLVHGVILFNVG